MFLHDLRRNVTTTLPARHFSFLLAPSLILNGYVSRDEQKSIHPSPGIRTTSTTRQVPASVAAHVDYRKAHIHISFHFTSYEP